MFHLNLAASFIPALVPVRCTCHPVNGRPLPPSFFTSVVEGNIDHAAVVVFVAGTMPVGALSERLKQALIIASVKECRPRKL